MTDTAAASNDSKPKHTGSNNGSDDDAAPEPLQESLALEAPGSLHASAEVKEQQQQREREQSLVNDEPHEWRGRDVVFVDPLDSSAPHWWPAMIVPTDEIDATMGCSRLDAGEFLVKYFEDFKYSTVNGSELRLFSTSQPPYTDFAANSPSFLRDKAIKGALSYMRSGLVHAKFQWRLWQTGSETLKTPFVLSQPTTDTVPPVEDPIQPQPAADDSDGSTTLVTAEISDHAPAAEAEDPDGLSAEHIDGDAATDSITAVAEPLSTSTRSSRSRTSTPKSAASSTTSPSPQPTPGADDLGDDDDDNEVSSLPPLSAATPASTATNGATPPATPSSQPGSTTTRSRRSANGRSQRGGAASASTNGTGTGRRGRPSLASKQAQQQQQQQQPQTTRSRRGGATATARNRQLQQQQQQAAAQRKLAAMAAAEAEEALAGETLEIQRLVKEMEEAQEEYRVQKHLARKAARELWLYMGNEWPPNLGTSTRYGKRRKAN
ncbi:hypothetical protein GGI07_000960 [Coemansia sp. Benny D115]|nr:hypothetical protein GGI07_000960 [Coemansia sp. Benny D115]